jgi:CBS domain-containing protein
MMTGTVREVMTVDPITVRQGDPLTEAAKLMRDADVGAVVVVDNDRVFGVITDRDITVRAVAEEIDPRAARVGDIVTHDLVAVSPDDDMDTAVELMRTHAVRRLPVLDGERLVGVVALGDLAVERDSDSALASISAEEPNN